MVPVDGIYNKLNRYVIGFDDIFRDFEHLSTITNQYPPYNLFKIDEHSYQLEFAIAGFDLDEIELRQEDGYLYVEGKKKETEDKKEYVHRGISTRSFKNRFRLAEYVEVRHAKMENGLLSVQLEQVIPEEKKPKLITIQTDK